METAFTVAYGGSDPATAELDRAFAGEPHPPRAVVHELSWYEAATGYRTIIPHLLDALPPWLAAVDKLTVELRDDTHDLLVAQRDLVIGATNVVLSTWACLPVFWGNVARRTWLLHVQGPNYGDVLDAFLAVQAENAAALLSLGKGGSNDR